MTSEPHECRKSNEVAQGLSWRIADKLKNNNEGLNHGGRIACQDDIICVEKQD